MTHTNGVDVQQLMATIEAVKGDSALAEFQFRASTQWQSGAHVRTQIQGFRGVKQEDHSRLQPFVLEEDEPPVLLGRNKGANAVELLLAGLTACLSVGIAYSAAARGITYRSDDAGRYRRHRLTGLFGHFRNGSCGLSRYPYRLPHQK